MPTLILHYGCKRAEADKQVLESLVRTEGESSTTRGKAASDYRKEAAKADSDRAKQIGNTILKALAGSAVIIGVVKFLDGTDIL